MGQGLVIGDLRVQHVDGRRGRSFTIVWPEGKVHEQADRFLWAHDGSGTQRTYAYLLVDHLRWLERECLPPESVTLRDLQRYMGIVGARVAMPLGEPWRAGKRPYGQDTLSAAASCLKGFYLHLAVLGINRELGGQLNRTRLPARADRDRALLGHLRRELPANPLAPRRVRRRHPKMLPDGARDLLGQAVMTARDRLVVTWLGDGGFRIGELCGLHLADLHLHEDAPCGDCRSPHVHVCHRDGNANRARAKTKYPWSLEDGVISGGMVRRASPAMVHAYFEYMTTEYPRHAGHGMLLVQPLGVTMMTPQPARCRRVMRCWAPPASPGATNMVSETMTSSRAVPPLARSRAPSRASIARQALSLLAVALKSVTLAGTSPGRVRA
jgi:hypothetical protein